jgi:hypothetical protein
VLKGVLLDKPATTIPTGVTLAAIMQDDIGMRLLPRTQGLYIPTNSRLSSPETWILSDALR